MCSIANLFDTNTRKFDAKKTLFFLSLMLRLYKYHLEKITFFKNTNSVLEAKLISKSKALSLRQPDLSVSYKENVVATFQSQNIIFLTWRLFIFSIPPLQNQFPHSWSSPHY